MSTQAVFACMSCVAAASVVPGLEIVGQGYHIPRADPFAAFQDGGTSLQPIGSYVGWGDNSSFGPVDRSMWTYPDSIAASVIPGPPSCYDPVIAIADLPSRFAKAVRKSVSIEYSFGNQSVLSVGLDASAGTASPTYQAFQPGAQSNDRVWLSSHMQCAKYTLALDWEAQQRPENWQLTDAFAEAVAALPTTQPAPGSRGAAASAALLSRFGTHVARSASFGGASTLGLQGTATAYVALLRNASVSVEAGVRLLHLARFGFDVASDPDLASMQAVQAAFGGSVHSTYRPVAPPECPTPACRDGSKWAGRLRLQEGLVAPVFLELRSVLDYLTPAFFPGDPSIQLRQAALLAYMGGGQACRDAAAEGCFLPTDDGCADTLSNGSLANPCLGNATCIGGRCLCDPTEGDFFGPRCGAQATCASNATCASWSGDTMCCRGDGLCMDSQDQQAIDNVMCYSGCFGTAAVCGLQQGFQCCADAFCRPQMCNSEPGGSCNATGACPALEQQMPAGLNQSIANGTLPLGQPLPAGRIAANGTHVGFYRLLPADFDLPVGLRFSPQEGTVEGTPSQPMGNKTFVIVGYNANGNASSSPFWVSVE